MHGCMQYRVFTKSRATLKIRFCFYKKCAAKTIVHFEFFLYRIVYCLVFFVTTLVVSTKNFLKSKMFECFTKNLKFEVETVKGSSIWKQFNKLLSEKSYKLERATSIEDYFYSFAKLAQKYSIPIKCLLREIEKNTCFCL